MSHESKEQRRDWDRARGGERKGPAGVNARPFCRARHDDSRVVGQHAPLIPSSLVRPTASGLLLPARASVPSQQSPSTSSHASPRPSPTTMAAARGDYTRVPVDDSVELKNAQQRSQSPQPRSPAPRSGDEPPASRAMVVFSVGFYLVAAIVVRPLPSPSAPGRARSLLCTALKDVHRGCARSCHASDAFAACEARSSRPHPPSSEARRLTSALALAP